MRDEDRTSGADARVPVLSWGAYLPAFALLLFIGLVLGSTGCMTRSETPVWGPDSTLVYPSKLKNDLNTSVTFQMKDSAMRDAAKRRDRERGREIIRLQRERENLLALEAEREQRLQADAKRKAEAQKKAGSKRGKKAKKGSRGGGDALAEPKPSAAGTANLRIAPDPAIRDSLASIAVQLATLMAEDSAAALAPWKVRGTDGRLVEERVFDIEEGARVQATVRLDNVYARGKRPLMIHFVWLNPERKRVFKRMLEYVPNDSTQTLTSSLTISPTKRSAGTYSLQIFLFREQIAEKTLRLRGKGVEEQTKGGGDAM